MVGGFASLRCSGSVVAHVFVAATPAPHLNRLSFPARRSTSGLLLLTC
jgi:hypothetical protein